MSSVNVDRSILTPAPWARVSAFLRNLQGGQQNELTHLLPKADRFPRTHSSLYR